jgi:hypothetical protein
VKTALQQVISNFGMWTATGTDLDLRNIVDIDLLFASAPVGINTTADKI